MTRIRLPTQYDDEGKDKQRTILYNRCTRVEVEEDEDEGTMGDLGQSRSDGDAVDTETTGSRRRMKGPGVYL